MKITLQDAHAQIEVKHLPEKFLSSSSHDLRSPLNPIIGFSKLLLKGMDGPLTELQRGDVEIIYEAGNKLHQMLLNVIYLSKIEAGLMHLECKKIDVGRMIDKLVAELSRAELAGDKLKDWKIHSIKKLMQEKEIEIRKEIAPDLPIIWADYLNLKLIMYELIVNAIGFTKKGTVTLAARPGKDGNIEIGVSDTGSGLPDSYFKELEEMQLYGSPFAAGAECLGVAVSWSMVRKHNGQMEIESEANAGTRIALTLPIEGNRPFFEVKEEKPGNELFGVYRKSANDNDGKCDGTFSTRLEAIECQEKMERDIEAVVYPDDETTLL
ncbi:MAG TPA: HAMP domain-containing sensor histidine kinase [Anaerolineales bacterium]|nr:HAMP domain-containing sensor histidine kinase [Anaerolineales bacterium]